LGDRQDVCREALQHRHVRGGVGMAGNNLTAVAPLPMFITRCHCSRDFSGQRCG
jgi:hypothetical protein